MDRDQAQAFERDLRQMGINPANIGKQTGTLPAIPASDDSSLQRNVYDGFYKYRAQEYWGEAELSSNKVEDFQKCQHYLMRRGNGIECKKCHIGWLLTEDIQVQDGKLYSNDKELVFAV